MVATGPGFNDWKEFVAAFHAYVAYLKDGCVASPIERLQVNQGRAQEGAFLQELFDGAVEAARQMQEKKQK